MSKYDPCLGGRVVAVTGCTSGIGEATAHALADVGARVVCLGRNEEKLAKLKDSLSGTGHITRLFDSSDLATVEAAIRSAVEEAGPLSGLVHSAGRAYGALLRDIDFGIVSEIYHLHCTLFMALAKAACKRGRYVAGEMSIVAMSSISSKTLPPYLAAYASSKAAVEAITACLAKEYAGRKIRFNSVAPHMVKTRMEQSARDMFGDDEYEKRLGSSATPLGDIAPHEVADCILFLLSSASAKITGTCMQMSAGSKE